MASKWKYADLDAVQRIELLKKGNKELFDEEVARTQEVTNARRELGLDTTEQENWLDTVGYTYYTSQSDGKTPISKTGYAKLYLDEKQPDTEPSAVKRNREGLSSGTTYISDAKRKIDNALKLATKSTEERYRVKKENARDELYDKYPYLKEQLLNEGASIEGGKMKRAYELLEKELADIYAGLDAELNEELEALTQKYLGMKDTVSEYRRNGTAKESLGVIADMLIKNAALQDGYNHADVPGVGTKYKEKAADEPERGTDADDERARIAAAYVANREKSYGGSRKNAGTDAKSDDLFKVDEYGDSGNGGFTESIYSGIEEAAATVRKNPGAAVSSISGMLVRSGLPVDAAAKAALELVELFINRKASKA